MYLRAISIGYAVPSGNFHASVHSVFPSALNLRLNADNGLLTLTASTEGDLPQGIRLDTPEGFTFEEFHPGEPADCRNDILHFENSQLTVQLSGARRWRCDLTALEVDTTDPAVSAAWRFVWDALKKRQRQMGSEIRADDLLHLGDSARAVVSRKAGEAMRELIDATRQYELTNSSAVNSLIGLGSGLTPTGDDLLVGYLAGLWCTVRDRSERMKFVSELGEAIIQCSQRTNDISRTYLYHAARGQVSSLLANLVEAIYSGENPDRLHGAAENAMRIGHTSGMDTVTGLLMGLAAWDGNHLLY